MPQFEKKLLFSDNLPGNYWRSESLEDFARDLTDGAIVNRNLTALAKRYGKPSASNLVYHDDLTAEEILQELKKDTLL